MRTNRAIGKDDRVQSRLAHAREYYGTGRVTEVHPGRFRGDRTVLVRWADGSEQLCYTSDLRRVPRR